MKALPASTWSGARRYHTGTRSAGGLAGLRPDEVPAILQRGEVVLPKGMGGRGSSGSTVTFHVAINAQGADSAALLRVQKSVDDLRQAVPGMVTSTTHRTQVRKTRA